MAKISKAERKARILELYKNRGYSYLGIQKVYKVSSKTIAKIVKGIVIKCSNCGTPKSKGRFHAHHPIPTNEDYTIPLCASCHARYHAEKRELDKLPKPTAAVKPGMTILQEPPKPSFRDSTPEDRNKIGVAITQMIPFIFNIIDLFSNRKRREEKKQPYPEEYQR